MIRIGILFIVLASCFMAFNRFRHKEPAYGTAWLACAAINVYYLLRLSGITLVP